MNYPLRKRSSLSRFLSLTLVMVLVLTMLSGCSLIPGLTKATEPSTDPSVEDTSANLPNIVDEPVTTEPPTTEPTVPTTTAPRKENVAVVKEQLSIRSSPSTGSRVITQLDAGDEVEVLRIEPIGTVNWAYVSSDSLNVMGWIVTEMLDMSNVQLTTGSTATPGMSDPTVNNNATQPTAPTVSGITGTGSSTTPANSQVGTVNTNTLNIRSSASTNGERVGQYTFGDRITILETSNGWGRTDKGWVSLNYVTMQQSSSTATITGSTVNIRSGAGTNNGVVGAYTRGDTVTILETTTVGTTKWGRTDKGWVSMDYVSTSGNAPVGNNTPSNNTTAPSAGTATVTGSGLNIRTGAGTNYDAVGVLKQGDVVTVLETATVGTSRWGRIDRGWICLDYVRMN